MFYRWAMPAPPPDRRPVGRPPDDVTAEPPRDPEHLVAGGFNETAHNINNRPRSSNGRCDMALTKCPDCTADVSDAATACIHCGRPLRSGGGSAAHGAASTTSRAFWKGFAVGGATTLVLAIAGAIAIGLWFTGPQLIVQVEMPDSVIRGEPFVIEIEASNPYSEAIELDNVDFPNGVLDYFEVVDVKPLASDDSPVGGFGSQTWYFRALLQPGDHRTVAFTVRAIQVGTPVIQFYVCNGYEDCTTVVRPIRVSLQPG